MSAGDLKERREALGLTQQGLADRIGVHVRTISKWERGVYAVPAIVAVVFELLEDRVRDVEQSQ
jgi:transcriptional regulator with XRE-family HTH domain